MEDATIGKAPNERVMQTASPPHVRRWAGLLWSILAACLILVVMPVVYAAALYQLDFFKAYASHIWPNILFSAGCNALVVLWAMRVRGSARRRLASIFNCLLLVHGTLAFLVLATRQPYSNQVMLLAAAASTLFGILVVLTSRRRSQIKAAVIGNFHALSDQLRVPFDWIEDPRAELSKYDLLLTSDIVNLSQPWARSLSRALLIGKSVRHIAEYLEEESGRVCLDHFDIDQLDGQRLASYQRIKRTMDIALVLLTLPVTIPLLSTGALLSWSSAGGPLFFVQNRVGRAGQIFRMYKLRTMHHPKLAESAPMVTELDDNRVTPIGRWLRRFRIDELPQLWNVLKGDMSVIGPRPEWDVLSDRYIDELPIYAYRHLVRPGMTGWAQVRGGYAADMAQTRVKVGYDLFYIKNLSFMLDIQILGRTILTLVTGTGAR